MARLTKTVVDAALPQTRPYFVWCDSLRGFGLRVFPSGERTYYCDYYSNGTRRRMAIGKHGVITTEQARKLAHGVLGDVTRGADPAQERADARKAITVAELCDRYVTAMERGLILGKGGRPKKGSTVYTDRGRITRHIRPLLGSKRARDLIPADINRFIRDVTSGATALVEKTNRLRGKSVVTGGAGTAARTAGLLGSILSFAVSEGLLDNNPARGVRRPAGNRRRRRLSADEYRRLGEALGTADVAWQVVAIARLLALSGARLGEIVNLQWREVDFDQRCLRLHDSKEGYSVRPLGRPALELLEQIPRTHDHVLPAARREGPFGGFARGWRRLVAQAGFADVSAHTLRHSFASMADDVGCSTPTISALLGHSAGSTTTKYIHKIDAALCAAADKVATAIDDAMAGDVR